MNDYAMNLLNKAVAIVCGLIVSVILARYLGVALRGDLAFLVQTSSMIAIVLGLGIGHAFIRRFRLSPARQTLGEAIGILLFQLAAFSSLGAAVAFIVDDEVVLFLVVMSISTAAFQQFEALLSAYDIRLKMRVHIAYNLVRLLSYLLMLAVPFPSLTLPVWISVGVMITACAAYLISLRDIRLRRPAMSTVRRFYAEGWLPMLSTLLIVANYSVDVVLLRALGTSWDLGVYAVAAGVVTYLWVVPDAIKEVLISRVVRNDDARTVLLPLKAALLATIATILLVASTGWFVVPLLFGDEFAGSYPLIVILTLGVLPMVFYKILGTSILAAGRRRFYFLCLLVAASANVLMNWAIIPSFGATGAAWVSVGTYAITGLAFMWYFGRVYGIRLMEMIFPSRDEVVILVATMRRFWRKS